MKKGLSTWQSSILAISFLMLYGCSGVDNPSDEVNSFENSVIVSPKNLSSQNDLELIEIEVLCAYNDDPNAIKVKLSRPYEILSGRQFIYSDEYYICKRMVYGKK